MRPVDLVHNGLSERYWRAELAAATRRPGQRWGLPAALAILGLNLAGFVLAPMLIDRISPAVLVLATITPTLLTATAVLVLSAVRGNGPVVDFGLPRTGADVLAGLRTGLAWGVVALVSALLVGLVVILGTDLAPQEVLAEGAALPDGWRLILALWVVLGAPFGEELLFRGLLWGALEKRGASAGRPPLAWSWLANRWVLLLLTAVLFALWHREWWRLPILLCGGLGLGVARMRSGSVFASTTAHSVNNLLPGLTIFFAPLVIV